ncbi:M23 family metallopeptidase [Egbenema bharatensis]|uniref:M23 family metallopeptidase n=1 Tax=Egbenema bharatensis TaxID=3463334 RepID=UPI003A8C20A9
MGGRTDRAIALLIFFLVGLMVSCLVMFVSWEGAIARDIASEPDLPITTVESEGQYARVPDWSQITFSSLPPILTAGSFVAPPEVNQVLGYDLSRTWQAGDTADTYLKLGDFQTSLYLQLFNLSTLAQMTNLDLSQIALGALEMAAWQTIDDLVTAIPGLGNYRVMDVAPIAALLRDQFPGTPSWNPDAIGTNSTIAEVLSANPDLGQLSLGELENLNEFALTDIPDFTNVPLQNLDAWGNSTIAGVPGLANIPFDQMPNPVEVFGLIGIVDVVYGSAETDRHNTISGSQQVGFSAACQTNCGYAELAGPLYGKQWISGKYQEVEGGFGALKAVNGGREPTGRHPFGNAFKVVVWDTDESTGTITTALFFRVCYRGVPDLGCTPYFLGPVPFLSHREKEPIFVGLLDALGGASNPAPIPAGVLEKAREWGIPESALTGGDGRFLGNGSLCGEGSGGVDFESLAAAFSSIEGNYSSVGSFVCDGDGHCGRGLGRYQYMSYRSDVRQMISQRDGGAAFLARVDSGATVSEAEVERFFSQSDQDNLFKGDQTRNINQAIGEGFSGGRLIERVGQIHFGGAGAPIDGSTSDIHGRLTLKTYGEELRSQYEGAVQTKGNSSCGRATGELTTPVAGAPVTSEYGWRIHPIYGDERFHTGIDLGAASGTPVQAADGGTVVFANISGSMTSGYGQLVIIDHGNGRETWYAHLNNMNVQEGQQVAPGDVLGSVGSSGGSTGPHLHFEVRENGEPVDPRQYINF